MNKIKNFSSFAELKNSHNILLKREGIFLKDIQGGEDLDVFVSDVKEFIQKGKATGILLEGDERWDAQSLIDYWAAKLYSEGHFSVDNEQDVGLEKFDPSQAPELDSSMCPYIGLDGFWPDDQKFFFGRDRFINKLIDHLRTNNLLAIVGPFGSGKSSVVFGGLIPRLKDGALPDSENWHIYKRMLPGTKPLASLEETLKSSVPKNQNVKTLLIIDHFEKIFTLRHDDEIHQQFINRLLELIQNPSNIVILIMHEDQKNQIARLKSFVPYFEKAEIPMPLLELNDLREMIEGPAKSIGLKLEGSLVEALITDLLGDPAALPLLQFTMLQLWEKRDRNRITLAAYRELGRAQKAIANSAEDFYEKLSPQEQDIAKYILMRMIQPTEEFGCKIERILVKTLYRENESESLIRQVLYKLIKARLVRQIKAVSIVDRQVIKIADDDQVEIPHKALALRWERMRNWLYEQWRTNSYLKQLDEFVELWEESGRSEEALLRDVSLTETLRYISDKDLSEKENEFVKESRKFNLEEQEERERLKFKAIIQALVAHARLQQERYKENQRGALLAYQAYIFNKRYRNFSDAYLGALLSEILNVSYFSRILEGHEGDIIPAIAFSRDEKTLASGSSDGTILLWDLPSGCLRQTLDSQNGPIQINSLVFQPNNHQCLVSGHKDGTVQQWDLTQPIPRPRELYRHEGYPIPESNHQPEVWALSFNRDGNILASGSHDCTIRLWDFDNHELISILTEHKNFVWSIAFHRDGNTFASGSRDENVFLWDLNQLDAMPQCLSVPKEEGTHQPYAHEVFSLAFSSDGTMLAAGYRDHFVRLWTLQTSADKLIALDNPVKLECHSKEVQSVAFHPDPEIRMLASGSNDQTLLLWDLRSLTANRAIVASPTVLDCQDTGVSSVAFNSNGDFLAVSGWNRKLELCDLRRPVTILSGKNKIYSVAVSSDGKRVVWGDEEGNIQAHQLDGLEDKFATLGKHNQKVRSIAFTSNKQMLVSGSEDGTVGLCEFHPNNIHPNNIKPIIDLSTCEIGFYSVACSNNGQWLVAGDQDETVRVWNLDQLSSAPLTVRQPMPSSDQRSIKWVCVAFSPDNESLASGHSDGTVYLRYIKQDSIESKLLNDHNRHRQEVRAVAFSPYGWWLASASADRTVQLWDLREEKLYVLYGANSGFSSIAFSPKGDLLAVGSFDGKIWLWDVNHPYATPIILPRRHNAGVSSVVFSPNGQKLVSGSHDGTVRIWNMNAESLANLICERVQRNLTQDEWDRFVDFGIEYLRTCPNLPSGKDAPPNAQSSEDWL